MSELQKLKAWIDSKLTVFSAVPYGLQGMSVHIINQEPVYVIPDAKLSLRARIVLSPEENISSVTWGRRDETGWDPQEVLLANCPGRSIKCLSNKPNVHASLEEMDSTLQVDGFTSDYRGDYVVTVTDHKGVKTTGHCLIRMYGKEWCTSVSSCLDLISSNTGLSFFSLRPELFDSDLCGRNLILQHKHFKPRSCCI